MRFAPPVFQVRDTRIPPANLGSKVSFDVRWGEWGLPCYLSRRLDGSL